MRVPGKDVLAALSATPGIMTISAGGCREKTERPAGPYKKITLAYSISTDSSGVPFAFRRNS
jgi:hypothetical protein